MNFLRPGGGVISFSKDAEMILENHRQEDGAAPEGGGMLLGRLIEETDDVVIDEATVPSGEDRRGRFFFNRAKTAAQRYINLVWRTSRNTHIYLGEWHTHPEDTPNPSDHDLTNWRRLANQSKYEQDFLIFAIVGRKSTRVWICHKASLAILELKYL